MGWKKCTGGELESKKGRERERGREKLSDWGFFPFLFLFSAHWPNGSSKHITKYCKFCLHTHAHTITPEINGLI